MRENEIKRVYSETTFERGLEYFREGRVASVMKFRGKLMGEVIGTDRYGTEVNLDNLGSRCSCPYGTNCKHGAAMLLKYFNREYIDGDEVMERVENMSSAELKEIIERLISMNPANLSYLAAPTGEKKAIEKLLAALDKEIKSRRGEKVKEIC